MNAALIVEKQHIALGGVPWIAFVLVLLTCAALPKIARVVRGIGPDEERMRPSWGFAHLGMVLVVYVASSLVVPGLTRLPHEGLSLLLLSAIVTVPPVVCVLIIAHRTDARGLENLGLRSGHALRAPIDGVSAYILTVVGMFALALTWIWLLDRLGFEVEQQSVITDLAALEGRERWVGVALGVAVIPFFEELLFRGFLQPLFVKVLQPAGGIMVTSAIFAILHGVSAFAPIFALSCLLGFVMMRTQRLHAAWTVHALHNGLQFLFMYVIPDPFEHVGSNGLVQIFMR